MHQGNNQKQFAKSKTLKRRGSRTSSNLALLLGSLIGFLALWEMVVRGLQISPVILPAPSRTILSLWALLKAGVMPRHLGITLLETLIGFAIGAGFGIAFGALLAQSRILYQLFYPYIVAFQSLPKVAIAPLMVIWFGFGLESKIMMVALISFFPIMVNTIVGLSNIDKEYLDLMISLTATPWQVFRFVRFPGSIPFIFAGLEVGIVMSVIGAIVGEFVGASAGMGYLIMQYNAQLNVAGVFAVLVVLAGLGIVLSSLVGLMRRRVAFWSEVSPDRFTGA